MLTGPQSLLNTSTRELLQIGMLLVHQIDWFGKELLRIWEIPEFGVRNTLCWGQKGDFEPLGVANYLTTPQVFYSRHHPRPLERHLKNYKTQSLWPKSLHLYAEKFRSGQKMNGARQYLESAHERQGKRGYREEWVWVKVLWFKSTIMLFTWAKENLFEEF